MSFVENHCLSNYISCLSWYYLNGVYKSLCKDIGQLLKVLFLNVVQMASCYEEYELSFFIIFVFVVWIGFFLSEIDRRKRLRKWSTHQKSLETLFECPSLFEITKMLSFRKNDNLLLGIFRKTIITLYIIVPYSPCMCSFRSYLNQKEVVIML